MNIARSACVTSIMPATLIFAGVACLSGCIFVPTFNMTRGGTNAAGKIGDAKSSKPVRLGTTTREQVLTVLGAPAAVSYNGRDVAYRWEVLNGFWLAPLCFSTLDARGYRLAVLRFDDAGVLRSVEYEKEDTGLNFGATWGGTTVPPGLPLDFLPVQEPAPR
jgi:hypothetical protein